MIKIYNDPDLEPNTSDLLLLYSHPDSNFFHIPKQITYPIYSELKTPYTLIIDIHLQPWEFVELHKACVCSLSLVFVITPNLPGIYLCEFFEHHPGNWSCWAKDLRDINIIKKKFQG